MLKDNVIVSLKEVEKDYGENRIVKKISIDVKADRPHLFDKYTAIGQL